MTDQLAFGFDAPEQPKAGALRHHHVRAHESVADAIAGERRAAKQDDAVLSYFRLQTAAVPGFRATPSQVWIALDGLEWPLPSARRAISGLTKAGLLVHHQEDKRLGLYGSTEGTWSLA